MPRSFEEIVSDLRRNGENDLAEELDRDYGKSTLRDKAARAAELEKELESRDARIALLERRPVQEKAFRAAGVDFDSLRPLESAAVENYDGELDAEKVAAFIEANQLPMTTGSPPPGDGDPNAAGVVKAARTAPSQTRVAAASQMTPDDAAQRAQQDPHWWDEWSSQHPVEAAQIEKGQTVRV